MLWGLQNQCQSLNDPPKRGCVIIAFMVLPKKKNRAKETTPLPSTVHLMRRSVRSLKKWLHGSSGGGKAFGVVSWIVDEPFFRVARGHKSRDAYPGADITPSEASLASPSFYVHGQGPRGVKDRQSVSSCMGCRRRYLSILENVQGNSGFGLRILLNPDPPRGPYFWHLLSVVDAHRKRVTEQVSLS